MAPTIHRKVIRLNNVVEEGQAPPVEHKKTSNLLSRAAWFATKIGILIGVSGYLYLQAAQGVEWAKAQGQEWYAWGLEKMTVEKVVTEFKEPTEATLQEIIQKVSADAKIDPLILSVILDKESSGGKLLYHFEEKKFYERAAADKKRGLSEDERRMENSSHGILHVMGYSARDLCGLKWSELYNAWTAAKCAASIVRKNADATKDIKNPGERLREIFRRYNGSGPDADVYADHAMTLVAQRLYKNAVKM